MKKDEMNINDEITDWSKGILNDENIQIKKSYKETIIKEIECVKNGQTKCPKCGATDIQMNVSAGKLCCNFCRYQFEPETVTVGSENISELKGKIISSGAKNIIADTDDILTLKCESCGAEVVIDTASSTQARCHWCRNTLSVNQR